MSHKLRLLLTGLLLTACFSVVSSTPARAGWLEFFFPFLKTGPDPSRTLRAPFADPDAVIMDQKIVSTSGLADNATPLNERHRLNTDIASWVERQISEGLSYSALDYKKKYRLNTKSFDKTGLAEYIKFLEDSTIWATLSQGKYDIYSIAQDAPELLNEGVIDGRYRWLFRVPVMITFSKTGLKKYSDLKKDIKQSLYVTLTIQVGRQANVKNEHGILIETWEGILRKTAQ